MAESSNLASLASLELRRNELTRAGLGYLCASAALSRLRHLGLAESRPDPAEWTPPQGGVVALASLDLTENGLTEDGVGMVCGLPGLGELARLDLGHNEIGNSGAAVLGSWAGAASLQLAAPPEQPDRRRRGPLAGPVAVLSPTHRTGPERKPGARPGAFALLNPGDCRGCAG